MKRCAYCGAGTSTQDLQGGRCPRCRKKTETPPPGSEEAVLAGCKCAVWDNHHGQGWHGSGNLFVMTEDCPLHSHKEEAKK